MANPTTTLPDQGEPDPAVTILGRSIAYKYVVAVVFIAALFLDILDTTIVNVALRTIAESFETTEIEWIVLGYTLSLAIFIPASGWLGDRFGTKRTFLTALVLFVGGSMLCGLATSIGQLVAFRVLQGIGGGMLTPIGIAMLFRAFPPAERARASTLLMIPTMVAPATGPVLGGFIADTIGWRWIFLVNVPIGVVALVFGFRYLREHTEPTAGPFDIPGFVLSGYGLAAIAFALDSGPTRGWTSPLVLGLIVSGIAAVVALVYVETHVEHPMLALRLLGDRIFRATNLTMFFAMMSFIAVTFAMPLYLQTLRGLDAFHSGLTTFPQAVGILISSQIAGRLYARIGPRRLVIFGMSVAAVAILSFTTLSLDTSLWEIRILMLVRGLGMGFCFVPVQASSYANIAPSDNGRASAIFSTQRQMAASIGVAVVSTVLISFMPLGQVPSDFARALTGYRWAFVTSTIMAVLAVVMASLFLRDEDAAASMGRPAPA
ncbi:MAG: DHA2 family efflux MFS transporter permease subunit [Desertimonas sp.]